jgi:hypothetical protein
MIYLDFVSCNNRLFWWISTVLEDQKRNKKIPAKGVEEKIIIGAS